MSDQKFEDLLRDRLQGFEVNPPADAWEKVYGEIQADPGKNGFLYPLGGGIIALLLTIPAWLYFTSPEESEITSNSDSVTQSATMITHGPTINSLVDPSSMVNTPQPKSTISIQADQQVDQFQDQLEVVSPKLMVKENQSNEVYTNIKTNPKFHLASTESISVKPAASLSSNDGSVLPGPQETANPNIVNQPDTNNELRKEVFDSPSLTKKREKSILTGFTLTVLPPIKSVGPIDQGENVFTSKEMDPVSSTELEPDESIEDRISIFEFDSKEYENSYVGLLDANIDGETITESPIQDVKPFSRWSLYFQAAPLVGYNRIATNKSDDVVVTDTDDEPFISGERLGFRAELGAQYNLTNRLQLFTGLLIYQQKQSINYTTSSVGSFSFTTANLGQELIITPQFDTLDNQYQYTVKNLGVQVGINYLLGIGKFQHHVGGGLAFHKPFNPDDVPDVGIDFQEIPAFYTFLNMYYRAIYPLKERFSVYLQPSLNYSLYVSDVLNAPFYVQPYGFGLNFGIIYRFRKK
ncbi:MAG: hypothetical protein O6848_10455 [Bacteroidetes bacterium]|nr:hypothetical protein [Bacteroidota bacterium]